MRNIYIGLLLDAAAFWGSVARVTSASDGPIVDLEYGAYQGYYNDTYDLNIWKR